MELVCLGRRGSCYIPILHTDQSYSSNQLKKDIIVSILDPIFTDSSILKIGQNIKYDEIVLLSNGFCLSSIEDTMLMSYTLFAGLHNHNLDLLCNLYLNFDKIKYKDLVGTGKKEVSFADVSIEKQLNIPVKMQTIL